MIQNLSDNAVATENKTKATTDMSAKATAGGLAGLFDSLLSGLSSLMIAAYLPFIIGGVIILAVIIGFVTLAPKILENSDKLVDAYKQYKTN